MAPRKKPSTEANQLAQPMKRRNAGSASSLQPSAEVDAAAVKWWQDWQEQMQVTKDKCGLATHDVPAGGAQREAAAEQASEFDNEQARGIDLTDVVASEIAAGVDVPAGGGERATVAEQASDVEIEQARDIAVTDEVASEQAVASTAPSASSASASSASALTPTPPKHPPSALHYPTAAEARATASLCVTLPDSEALAAASAIAASSPPGATGEHTGGQREAVVEQASDVVDKEQARGVAVTDEVASEQAVGADVPAGGGERAAVAEQASDVVHGEPARDMGVVAEAVADGSAEVVSITSDVDDIQGGCQQDIVFQPVYADTEWVDELDGLRYN